MPHIGTRDLEYIENRILAHGTGLLEAHERLQTTGNRDLADRLMASLQSFTDECRSIRHELIDRYRAGRRG
jgi:hypothetical protein